MEIPGIYNLPWFDLLQHVSLLVGLFATLHSLRADTRERKIQNLFTVTQAHRDIWKTLYSKPELNRVLKTAVDLKVSPITTEEQLFVHFLILHLRASFKARSAGMEFSDDALEADIRRFFSRPIPRAVWETSKRFQDLRFQAFVEKTLKS